MAHPGQSSQIGSIGSAYLLRQQHIQSTQSSPSQLHNSSTTPTPHNHHWSPESSPRTPLPLPPLSHPQSSSSLGSKPDTLYSSSASSSVRLKGQGDHLFNSDHEPGFAHSNAGSSASLSTLNSPVASSTGRSLPFLKHHHHHHQHSNSTAGSGNGSGGSSGSRHGKHSSKDEHGHRRHDAPEPIRPSIQQTVNSIPSMMDQGGKGNRLEPMMTMQDWLQKRSTSLQLVWKRRWCVLRDDRLLFYRSNVSHPYRHTHCLSFLFQTIAQPFLIVFPRECYKKGLRCSMNVINENRETETNKEKKEKKQSTYPSLPHTHCGNTIDTETKNVLVL